MPNNIIILIIENKVKLIPNTIKKIIDNTSFETQTLYPIL